MRIWDICILKKCLCDREFSSGFRNWWNCVLSRESTFDYLTKSGMIYNGLTNCLLFVLGLHIGPWRGFVMSTRTFLTPKTYHEILRNTAVRNENVEFNKKRSHRGLLRDDSINTPFSHFNGTVDMVVHGDITCPSTKGVMATTLFSECPAYYVTEYDPNRIPAVIFQVHCRCLSCHGPNHRHRCTPLFRFINAYRVVSRTVDGELIYGKVREPVSYSCKCRKKRHGTGRTYIPP